ncbi:MAG: hypothetical protein UX89_C0018G0028, partial [Parcubacteria group bacterium GW2011_GWA2_47_16]
MQQKVSTLEQQAATTRLFISSRKVVRAGPRLVLLAVALFFCLPTLTYADATWSIGPDRVSLSPTGAQAPGTSYTVTGYVKNSGGTTFSGFVNYEWDYSINGGTSWNYWTGSFFSYLDAGASKDVSQSGTVGAVNGNSYSFRLCANDGVTQRCATTASITPTNPTFTVSSTGGGSGGTITPPTQTVTSGNTTTFTVTPGTNFVASVSASTGCGTGTLSGTTYTTGTITGNCTVTASFDLPTHSLAAAASPTAGGSVNCKVDTSDVSCGDTFNS